MKILRQLPNWPWRWPSGSTWRAVVPGRPRKNEPAAGSLETAIAERTGALIQEEVHAGYSLGRRGADNPAVEGVPDEGPASPERDTFARSRWSRSSWPS